VRALFPLCLVCLAGALGAALPGLVAPCGNTGSGYEAWKRLLAGKAQAQGVGRKGVQALMNARSSTRTIGAERNQKSFRYSPDKFLQMRGADAIVLQGRARKARSPDFCAGLEQTCGVPAGVLLAIHGMETGFGNFMGDTNVVSAIATLSYDCRRSGFFTGHLIAALILVDQGTITAQSVGARHGEVGHIRFLPGNVLVCGVDGNGDGRVDLGNLTDAMASTASFLAQKGWQPGHGCQEGDPSFAVIKQWNAATVCQQAIALMGARIDGWPRFRRARRPAARSGRCRPRSAACCG
jgi:membrane-bound lytic murein transglycosylase B